MMKRTELPPASDRLTAQIEEALRQARIAARILLDPVIPHLPPGQRGFPQKLVQPISQGEVFSEDMLGDLDTLIRQLRAEADSCHVWETSDCPESGGLTLTTCPDARGRQLHWAADHLRQLYDAVAATLDIRRASLISRILAAGN